MRTMGLSLGLLLLCVLRVQAADPGNGERDKSKHSSTISQHNFSASLSTSCVLRVQAADPGNGERDKSKVAGKWYITAMASDSERYLEKRDQLKMAMANIEVLGNGDLNVSFAIPTPGICKKFSSIYKPTGRLDEYTSDRGNKTVRLVDTDDRSYMVVFATRPENGKTLRMLRLYSRSQWVRPQIKRLFGRLSRLHGFTDETIWILPKQEECRLDEP